MRLAENKTNTIRIPTRKMIRISPADLEHADLAQLDELVQTVQGRRRRRKVGRLEKARRRGAIRGSLEDEDDGDLVG